MPKQGYDGQYGVRGHAVHAPLSRLLLRVDSGGLVLKRLDGRSPELYQHRSLVDGLDINVSCIEVRFLKLAPE